MMQALVVLPVCGDSIVVVIVVVVAIVYLSSASPLPTPQTLPRQHRHHTPSDEHWGRGTRTEGGYQQDWMMGRAISYRARTKKGKISGTVVSVTHNFYMLLHPRQKIRRCSHTC